MRPRTFTAAHRATYLGYLAAGTRHIDQRAWAVEQLVEREEREGLLALRDAFNARPDVGGAA